MNNTFSLIHERLTQALQPTLLEVIDESAHHVGHVGAQNGAGHYLVRISSPQFEGQNLISNHRLVYQALEGLIPSAIHALKIQVVSATA